MIIALDFDGVICNGMKEYFETSKRTYNKIWNQEKIDDQLLFKKFSKLRPVIEIGWEMPILLRALILNYSEENILNNWQFICQEILKNEHLKYQEMALLLDQIRDLWIDGDRQDWLNAHSFYDGIIDKLNEIINSNIKIYIITTKSKKFTQELLNNQGIKIKDEQIFGKEKKSPKYEILREIIQENKITADQIYFVEDRLEALELVAKQPDLKTVNLFLAAWGYNNEKTRNKIINSQNICLLSLIEFTSKFPN